MAWKSGDQSSAKWRLEDKVCKVGNMATKIMGLVVYNVAWSKAYLHIKCHLDSWSIQPFGHNRYRLQIGGGGCCAPSFLGEMDPYLTQCGLGQGLPPYQVASWSIQPFGHNRHGLKIGGCAPFSWGLVPHLTQCDQVWGLPPHQVASWFLIYRFIQPFGHNTWAKKWRGCCAPFCGCAGSSSNTMGEVKFG